MEREEIRYRDMKALESSSPPWLRGEAAPPDMVAVSVDVTDKTILIHCSRKAGTIHLTLQQAADLADAIGRAGLTLRGVDIGEPRCGFNYELGGPCRLT